MNKLELKHIAPYLPYGLKIFTDYDGVQSINGMPDMYHVSYYDNKIDSGDEPHINDIKPILRPLSDLKKVEFRDSFNEVSVNIGFDFDNYSDFCGFFLDQTYIFDFTYEIVWWLIENHFDVFGLIPLGLAIDINTL